MTMHLLPEPIAPRRDFKRIILGTPISPTPEVATLRGFDFCLSYYHRRRLECQLPDLLRAQDPEGVLLLDNGAFSAWKAEEELAPDHWVRFERWAEGIMHDHPCAVAVIPDVITGTAEQNVELFNECALPLDRSMVVWHMHEPLSLVDYYLDAGVEWLAVGSSGKYRQPGSQLWHRRMRAFFARLADHERRDTLPWLHLMRAQAHLGAYAFNSADSTNVAMNAHRLRRKGYTRPSRALAQRLDTELQHTEAA